MGLFPEEGFVSRGDAKPSRVLIREKGTRHLVLGFSALVAGWFVVGQVRDRALLQKTWPTLAAHADGLTVVGTLDARSAYDRNMFRIVTANKASRVELTDSGWRTIFHGSGKTLFNERVGNAILAARQVDGAIGYAMLEPFLCVGVRRLQGEPPAETAVTEETPVLVPEQQGRVTTEHKRALGALIAKYAQQGVSVESDGGAAEGGGNGGHEVEHGLPIPGEMLEKACPVVLTDAQFTRAFLEEHPASVFQGKTFDVHLELTPEGRSRFFQWSHAHPNESLVFLLKGQVVAAPRVAQALDVDEWVIRNVQDEPAVKALMAYVNAQKAR